MNMRIITLLFALNFCFHFAFGQAVYENKQFGIKVLQPTGWNIATNEELENNLKKIELTQEQLARVLSSNKGVVSLSTYYKYRIDSVSGLIPTAKITVRANPTASFAQFRQAMEASNKRMTTILQNFEYIDSLKEVKLSGYPALYYSCRYVFSLADGSSMKVRNKYYMIPKGTYFISISLMDNETNEDCAQVYEKFINSLELTK